MNYDIPYRIHWDYFTNWAKNCDKLTMNSGACYGFVFNETKPESYQHPAEFKECVYIGESAGMYIDQQNGKSKTKDRSFVHKRMSGHCKQLYNGGEGAHDAIIENYGYGHEVLNGILTGKPMWLGLILPRPDIPPLGVKGLVQMWERKELFDYYMRFGRFPISNKDCVTGGTKQEDSLSSQQLNSRTTLDCLFA